MVEKGLDKEGYELRFEKINAQPIEYYDDTIGELVSQDIYKIAHNPKTDTYKINIVKRSTKGNEIFRRTVTQNELREILWGLPKELTYGLGETRQEFKFNMEAWNAGYESKIFITDNDGLPIYSRGKIDQSDEAINSYVIGKLLPIYEEFGNEFIGEKPYTVIFARPESFAYIFNNDMNISVSFTELNTILDINKLYLAAMKVFFGKECKEFRLNYAISDFIKSAVDLNVSNLSCVIFNKDLELHFSNLNDFEIECLRKVIKAFPRIKEELNIQIQDTIVGGNSNAYGMSITDKGIFVIKNQLENFLYLKLKYLNNALTLETRIKIV